MSRIDELIQTLCPYGVEYKPLGELGLRNKGTSITAGQMKTIRVDDGPIRVFAGGRTVADVAEGSVPAKDVVRVPSIIVKSRGHIGFTYYDRPFTHKAEIWSYSISHRDVDQKYVFQYLLTQVESLQEIARGTSVKLPQLGVRDTDTLRIPIPPIEVQREIVRVLDLFATLEAQLEAELEARGRQYVYYRDSLLNFRDAKEVRWARMGDLATIVRGASPRPIQASLTDAIDGVPWIKIGDVAASGKYITGTAERVTPEGACKSRRVHPGDFVLSNSMSFGRPYISKIEGCIHDGWLAISDFSASYVPDFLYHLLRSAPVQAELARRAGGGTVQNLNADIVKSIVIPVPSLGEQRRIANILDKFDALVNDPAIGLPAELAARRKQHEYYRDRLLTFEEAVA